MEQRTSKGIERITRGWNIARVLRLAIGLGLIVFGVTSKENVLTFFGSWLMLQGLLNLSCCGAGGCRTSKGERTLYKDVVKPYRPQR